jgi:DNA-binding MarR family transcriptional regulator
MVCIVGRALERRLKQRPLKDPVIEAILNVLVSSAALNEQFDALYGRFGLTSSAYNVLRILRGEPEGHPRGEIAERLVNRAPDVTRLIDRLARRGLVRRVRTRTDRRLSVTRLTPKGVELLDAIEPAIEQYRATMAGRLSVAEWKQLSRLCEHVYGNED